MDQGNLLPMVIMVSNTKGGVGKSTIAVHLAGWLFDKGYDVVLLDTDKQATSSTWLSNTEPELQTFFETEPKQIVSTLKKLIKEFDFVICDTEGSYGVTGTILPTLADLAIVPLQPSEADVDELEKALFHIQFANTECILVFSMTSSNDRKSNRLRELLCEVDVPVSKHTIRRLNAIRDVAKKSLVTRGTSTQAKNAARDFNQLFSSLLCGKLPRPIRRAANA